MSLEYIRECYNVPARRWGCVEYNDKGTPRQGMILGSLGPYLRIRLDGDKHVGNYHPTDNLKYLDERVTK